MEEQLEITQKCEQHRNSNEICPDTAISYSNNKWTINAPNASYCIFFCPWCGKKLN